MTDIDRPGEGAAPMPTPEECLAEAKRQRSVFRYDAAREWAKRGCEMPDVSPATRDRLLSVWVGSTYKDLYLNPERSFPEALELLREGGHDPRTTTDLEMLSLAGAIHKRWWEYDTRATHLEDALGYYQRAYQDKPAREAAENGYPAINAAYLLDLLASLDATEARRRGAAPAPDPRLAEAAAIRRRILASVAETDEYWVLATLAEANFGLGNAAEVERLLTKAAAAPTDDWTRESTLHQLASLLRVQAALRGKPYDEESPLWRAVKKAFGPGWTNGLHSAFAGRVGLALSGGGFRASLYHIGVLARLAELGVLSQVEVISCVSGGSIIGARYYLEVRRLLRRKTDDEIGPEDYVQIVRDIEAAFLEAMKRNIRTRLFADRRAISRARREPGYSRTERLGELFEEHLYSDVDDELRGRARCMDDLFIDPAGWDAPPAAKGEAPRRFDPRFDNFRRKNKVPILVLNATNLNTGHTWQFTAAWMGEVPGAHDAEIGGTELLGYVRYTKENRIRLGRAVAASACVPGLFDPVVLEGALAGGPDAVHLADGGVYDNQGTAALLTQNCSVLLVSDASGQLHAENRPGTDPLSVSTRANNVLMARVREAQYATLRRLRDAGILRALFYTHLRMGLDPAGADGGAPGARTSYKMRRDVQARLATLRTDLDAFSELEAAGLMASGYRAARSCARALPAELVRYTGRCREWRFRTVRRLVATHRPGKEAVYAHVCALLEEGASTTLRMLSLVPSARRRLLLGLTPAVPGGMLTGIVAGGFLGGKLWNAVRKAGRTAAGEGEKESPWRNLSGLVLWATVPVMKRELKSGTPAFLERGRVPPLLDWLDGRAGPPGS